MQTVAGQLDNRSQRQVWACAGILGALMLCLIGVLWEFPADLQMILVCIAAAGSIYFLASRRAAVKLLDLKQERKLNGWAQTIALSLAFGALLVTLAWFAGAWHGLKRIEMLDKSLGHWIGIKLPTVVVQQLLLQKLIVPLLGDISTRRWQVILLGGLLFAALHTPNPVLMALTFMAGMAWITLYLIHRQLLPLIVSHFFLAILAAGTCGEYVLNMRVGSACMELLPRTAHCEDRTFSVFPRCVTGSVDQCHQTGGKLVMQGWVSDEIHLRPPTDMVVRIGEKFFPVEFKIDENESRNLDQYQFIASVDVLHFDPAQEPKSAVMYAANTNGHYSAIGRMGEIYPFDLASAEKVTQVFPVEIDGRIHGLRERGQQIYISGWAADIKNLKLQNELWVYMHGEFIALDLTKARIERPDIAENFGANAILDCGFAMPIPNIKPWQAGAISFFVPDEQQKLHPIQLTEHAQSQLATLVDQWEDPVLRR